MALPKNLSWHTTALEAIEGVDLSGHLPHDLACTFACHYLTAKSSLVYNVCQKNCRHTSKAYQAWAALLC